MYDGAAMEKLFHFESPRQRYKCDAAIVWCFDNRFEMALRKLVKRLEINYYDPIRIAGGTKCLASPEHERDREFVLEQIRISMRLHETGTVFLMLHSDCGAYGGLAAFEGDKEKEALHHNAELRRAAACLAAEIPGLNVRCCFVDFEGVWELILGEGAAVKIA
jgi:carbonic anhydrase